MSTGTSDVSCAPQRAWWKELPANWRLERLKRIACIRLSGVDKKSVEGEHPVQLCNYTDVYYGDRIHGHLPLMRATAPARAITRLGLKADDVLITKDSEARTDIAVPAYVQENLTNVVCGYHLALLRPDRQVSAGRFLFYCLLADGIRDHFHTSAYGITRFGLTSGSIGNARLPLPPVVTQERIANFLDRETAYIDRLIEKKERLIELLEEKRSALITRAVTKGLDPDVPMKDSGVGWIGEIPEHWDVAKMKRVATLSTGHTPSRNVPKYWEDCQIPWVTLADVAKFRGGRTEFLHDTTEKISELGLRNSAAVLIPKGTVLLSRTASVGFSVIAGVDLATTQDFVNWTPGSSVSAGYLLYVCRAMKPEFRRITMGSTHQTIYMPDVHGLMTPVPPRDEQERIVAWIRDEVDSIQQLGNATRNSITLLRERRSALITAAVTGQIDVTEYEASGSAPLEELELDPEADELAIAPLAND